jgi:TRAP-type transport system small permease protein
MRKVSAQTLLVWVSGGALLVAMLADTLAMLGRQVRWPLPGSIEIVQGAVIFAACGGLIVAARERAHACVHLLRNAVTGRTRKVLDVTSELAAALLYITLLVGSVWIAFDLWNGQEESEVWRLPYRPLRIVAIFTLVWVLLLALRDAWQIGKRS